MGTNASQQKINSNSLDASVDFINSIQSDSINKQIVTPAKPGNGLVLTNFRWGLGGNTVLVTGTFTKWKDHIPLFRDGAVWSRTIDLEKGIHFYKFIVDDEWRFNPQDPSKPDQQGNINNFINTTNYEDISANVESQHNMSQYTNFVESQTEVVKNKPFITIEQFGLQAPRLPSQFQRCIFMDSKEASKQLNSTISPNQSMEVEGSTQVETILQKLNKQQLSQVFDSCHSLQAPVHVTLNHVRMKDHPKFNVYSISHRFKSKYATYKLYINKSE